MKNQSSSIVISVGFSAILLLLVMLIGISIYTIVENNKSISEIVAKQKDVSNVFAMRDAAHQRALYLYRMVSLDDPFDRDDVYLLFKDEAVNFITASARLREGSKEHDIQKDWEKTAKLASKGSSVQNAAVDLIRDELIEAAHQMILNEVIPAQDDVMSGLTDLHEKQRVRLNNEIAAIRENNQTSYWLITLVGAVAILLGLIIAVYVYRHNQKTTLSIQQQQKIAEQANKSKSDFLANMSHEIRTPLTAIIGFSESILGVNTDQAEQRKGIQTIARNGKHLLKLINDILDVSKIEAGQLQIESIDTHPVSVLAEVESIIGAQAKGSVTVSVHFRKRDNTLCFTVTDTGIGMNKEATNKIFSAFSQADSSTTRKFGGTGLGLTISRQLAEKMHGHLSCTSQEGHGSRFCLALKLEEDVADSFIYEYSPCNRAESSPCNADNIPELNGNILLAEDSPDNQRLIRVYVERTGANLTVVENGEQAVEQGLSCSFDLILMDMQMPVMDGISATTLLRASGYTKPIIMLSANALQSDRDHAKEVGVDDYVVKPINLDHFYEVLANYLPGVTAEQHKPHLIDPGMQELVDKFIQGLPGKMQDMNAALHAMDWEIISEVSHNLKGMGGSFGFPAITTASEKVHSRARQQIIEGLEELVMALNDEVDKILQQHAA
jgi:signal transduction histidine kinase/response regulator of citrate/malate metabolism